MEKTFQRADLGQYGMMLKVVPMTDENVVNQINCFRVDGTADSPVTTQSILPGTETVSVLCQEMEVIIYCFRSGWIPVQWGSPGSWRHLSEMV
jgi:hypothetical protein